MGEFIGALSAFLDIQTALVAEFYKVIYALEEAQKLGLTNVWLECDSVLVCAAFTARTNVPWMFHECFVIFYVIFFKIMHLIIKN